MKRIVTIILACLFAPNLSAQSSSGGIYFKYSRTDKNDKPDNAWVVCPNNSKYRDLYMEQNSNNHLTVLNSNGEDITGKCTFTSSNEGVARFGGYYEIQHKVGKDPTFKEQEMDLLPGDTYYEKIDYPKNRLAARDPMSSTTTPMTVVKAKYGNSECSFRVFVYPAVKVTKDGDGWIVSPKPPIRNIISTECRISDIEQVWGIETGVSPKWSFSDNNGRYTLHQDVYAPGATYQRYYRIKGYSDSEEKTDVFRDYDLKPGDFVIWNASKSRYEAIDGGLRSKNRNLGKDASSFKNQVIGIVATVYKDTPYGTSGLKGIYTSDGKMHHALVIDLQDCDKTWEYSSDNDDPAAGNDIWGHGLRRGYTLTKFFLPYNDRRGASHRIKPIYWIAARNSSKPLQGGTTGWYLPSVYEMEHANLQAVNASLSGLIKAGRTDVGRIRVESDYWTCEYDRNHNDKAYVWNFIDKPNNHKVKTYVRKKQATLFVRAVFSL